MGLFDFLAPQPNQGAMNNQTNLLQDDSDDLEKQRRLALKGIGAGYDSAIGLGQQGVDLFKGITDQRQGATDMYFNSLGLNGQTGNDAALGAYQQSPGYGFALDQANQNVLRNGAATGNLNSGATGMALSDRAQQLQNLDYGNWQDRLHGLDVLPAAQSQATQLNNLGNFFTGKGNAMADARLGFAGPMSQSANNQASLIGQQQSANMAAEQQGWANALGIGSMLTGGLGAYWGKNGA
jgi:hypothetical protein